MSYSFFQPISKVPVLWTETKRISYYIQTTKASNCMFVCYAWAYKAQYKKKGGGGGGGGVKKKKKRGFAKVC